MNTRPRGYGWSVVATVDGFDVVDRWTDTVVDTTASNADAWSAVVRLSRERLEAATTNVERKAA